VIRGRKTWVGYGNGSSKELPALKPSILSPADELAMPIDANTENRLNFLYAKDYSVYRDLSIFINSFSKLGRNQKEKP
jgi:hypothetical protein